MSNRAAGRESESGATVSKSPRKDKPGSADAAKPAAHRLPVFGKYQADKAGLAWCAICKYAIVYVAGVWWHTTRTQEFARHRRPK
jgi:hypothetical protein